MTTNDPSHPTETLICKGTILEALHLDKRNVNLGRLSRTSTGVTKTITITRGDAGRLNPKLLPMKNKSIGVTLKEIEAGEKYSLEITAKPPFTADSLRAKVQVETGVAEDPTVTIPVYASFAPRVAARPSRVVVPTRANADWKQPVRLTWDAPEPHKILSASVTDPRIIVNVTQSDEAHEVVLTLASAQALTRGSYTLTIVTDDVKMPEVRVPISVGGRSTMPGVRKGVTGARRKAADGRADKPGAGVPRPKPRSVIARPAGTPRPKPSKTSGG